MKRFFAFLAAILLMVSALSSCRKPESSKNGDNLTPSIVRLADI